MKVRDRTTWVFVVLVGLTLVAGCKKKSPTDPDPTATSVPTATPTASPTATQGPVTILHETFENTMDSAWVFANGGAAYTATAKQGTWAFDISGDALLQADYPFSPSLLNGYVECWLYDDVSDSSVHVEFGTVAGTTGVMTNHSATNYAVWSGALTVTPIVRSTGWHKFRWERDFDGSARLYIDGTKVWTHPTSSGSFDWIRVYIGDIANPGLINGAIDEVIAVRLP